MNSHSVPRIHYEIIIFSMDSLLKIIATGSFSLFVNSIDTKTFCGVSEGGEEGMEP